MDWHGSARVVPAGGRALAAEETSQCQITSIMEDREDDIWVATAGGGINRLRPKLFVLYNTKSGLAEDLSDSVCTDDQGDVWLANRGSGVFCLSDGKVSAQHLHIGDHSFRAYAVCRGSSRHGVGGRGRAVPLSG